MKSKLILCSGGARSGKSEFAEKLALSLKGEKAYIATARIYDEEVQTRVNQHKARRGEEWKNYEIPLHISASFADLAKDSDILLLDCLTMYVMNYMMDCESDEVESILINEMNNLFEILMHIENKTLICVTNEIGLGIVPEDALSRRFRDLAGLINRMVANQATEVFFTVSGITIEIKGKGVKIHG